MIIYDVIKRLRILAEDIIEDLVKIVLVSVEFFETISDLGYEAFSDNFRIPSLPIDILWLGEKYFCGIGNLLIVVSEEGLELWQVSSGCGLGW